MPKKPKKPTERDPARISPKNPNGRIDPPEDVDLSGTAQEGFLELLKKASRKQPPKSD